MLGLLRRREVDGIGLIATLADDNVSKSIVPQQHSFFGGST